MNELERRLIERIRESDEAKRIVEGFIFGPAQEDRPEPSDVHGTSP